MGSMLIPLLTALAFSCQPPSATNFAAEPCTAAPAPRPRLRALIVDGQNNHAWPRTSPVLEAILRSSGRFEVEVVSSPEHGEGMAGFAPDFAAHDVVVSNYNGDDWPAPTRAAFEAFVGGGGGFVSVHAADNAFPGWPAYNRMIGVGGWGGRDEGSGPYLRLREGEWVHDTTPGRGGSHGRMHEFLVEKRTEHPILEGMPASWLHRRDELYDRLRGPAQEVTVLASAFATRELGGSGEHEPVLMTIPFREGRVFHTTLGHDVEAMHSVGFQATLVRGCEWAATGEVHSPLPVELPGAAASLAHDPLAFESLFDGESLQGWIQRNGTATYRVEDGVIIGRTAEGSPNSFLCTEREYGDFELHFEVWVDDGLNSGVQVRSHSLADYKKGRVHGPQVEIEKAPGEAGYLYSEGTGRGWLSPIGRREQESTRSLFQNGAWNHYRVLAEGPRIRTWVNGMPAADHADEQSSRRGFIGLQVHSVAAGSGPFQVRWRGLRLREL